MTSYRIAAVAAVSSANACLSALVYMPPPASEPRMAAWRAVRGATGASGVPGDTQAASEAESGEWR
jgi:hypothetical protein